MIDPSVSSALVTFTLADDSVAELTGELEIVIASVEIGNGRQGAIPQHSGSVPLDLIDDDSEFCAGRGGEGRGGEGRGGEGMLKR